MTEKKFLKWVKWENKNTLVRINLPGVYCIAISKIDLTNKKFEWISEIKYIGMTNSILGLKGRLKQFDNTIIGKTGHGGADRFRYKHQNYKDLVKKLFLSTCSFQCDVKSNMPEDLRIMGEVAKFEYDCFAMYIEKFGSFPEFNKRESPKYSLTYGK
jgi:hypothetical protein